MRSWQSILFEKFLVIRRTKNKFIDLSLMDDYIAAKYNEPPYQLNPKFQQKHQIKAYTLDAMDYYVINEMPNPKKVIYYFHGGAYINDPLSFHWRYLVNLAKATNFMIVVPIYLKLPRFTHKESFPLIHQLYDQLVEAYNCPFIFMGDSAGGGYALAFAQDVKATNKKQCEQVVLFSPWLEVTGEDPRYEELQKVDPMLGVKGAQWLGRLWAGDEVVKHYRVSPYYGELHGIGDITLFVGTAELLLVDARMLKERAEKEGVPLQYFEFEQMNHVFPVFPIPEARKVMTTLLPILLK